MRKPSKIMSAADQKAVVKELKEEIRDAKTDASDMKKAVMDIMKEFMANPTNGGLVKEYRSTVNDHIKAVKELAKLQKKLSS